MCGIFGVLGAMARDAGAAERLRVHAQRQTHRGPDGFGEWSDASAGIYFAHNRLAIIDLTTASSQPFETPHGVLLYNGEIYNYIELRRELEREGVRFATSGDTEVLAAVLSQWGTAGLHRLRGMFAFAYWSRGDRTLTLVRDRFGIKPLFIAKRAGSVLFASELEALRDTGVFAETNDDARAIYHLLNYLPAPFTLFRDIVKVPPGHLARITAEGYTLEAWYRLEPRRHGDLSTLMERSVAEHMRCDVDYGVFLSGGLDSNLIASIAKDVAPGRLRTFSIGFREFPAFDETQWIELAARRLGSEHHQHDVSFPAFEEAADACLVKVARGEAFADASFIPTWMVSRAASRASKVALSGDGADEIFGGYRKHRAIRIEAYTRLLPSAVTAFLRDLSTRLPESRESRALELVRRFRKLMRGAGRDEYLRQLAWLYTFYPEEVDVFMPGRGRAAEGLLVDLLRGLPRLAPVADEINDALYADTMIFLSADMLHKVDLASMDHALEVRVPFLDHEIVETAFALAGTRKVGLRKGKLELRRRFGARLPPELLRLPKRGFESPLSSLFRGPWANKLEGEGQRLKSLGVDGDYLARLQREHSSSHADHSIRLWNLLVLSRWAR